MIPVGQHYLCLVYLHLPVYLILQISDIVVKLGMMAVDVCEVSLNILLSQEKVLLTRFRSWAEGFIVRWLDGPHACFS